MIAQVFFIKNKFANLLGRLIDEKGFYDSNWICEVSKSQLYSLYLKESKCMYTRSKMFFQKLKSYLPSTKYSFEEERLGHKRVIKHKVVTYDEEGVNRRKYLRYCILPNYDKACEEFFKTTGINVDPPNIPTLNVYYMNQMVDENVSLVQTTFPQSPQPKIGVGRSHQPQNIGLPPAKKYTFNMITPEDYATGAYKSKRRKKEPELDEVVEDHPIPNSQALNSFVNAYPHNYGTEMYDPSLFSVDLMDIDENVMQQLMNQYQ